MTRSMAIENIGNTPFHLLGALTVIVAVIITILFVKGIRKISHSTNVTLLKKGKIRYSRYARDCNV